MPRRVNLMSHKNNLYWFPKEKKSIIPIDEEIAQVQFTTVDNQNISGISSGITTPQFNSLSTPLNYRALQNELGH